MEGHDLPLTLLLLHHGGYDVLGLLLGLLFQADFALYMRHGHFRDGQGSDFGNMQAGLHLYIPSGDGASAFIVESLVDAGVVFLGLVRQEHTVYGDVVVLLGESGSEQLSVLGVLAFLHVLNELSDRDLIFPSNRTAVHLPPLSV